jgi:hypothetical protein
LENLSALVLGTLQWLMDFKATNSFTLPATVHSRDARPFDASFELHGGDHLTLLEIVRSRLPSAELAFLAAFHTAELAEDSVSDEGLHLVAAMQYCGFRSAVRSVTMGAKADIDGPC